CAPGRLSRPHSRGHRGRRPAGREALLRGRQEERRHPAAEALNPRLLVVHAALHAALFPIPVITLFLRDQVGMSWADIMILQALFGLAVVMLEFPSGYLADRIGHRRALIIGATLSLVGWLGEPRAASVARG